MHAGIKQLISVCLILMTSLCVSGMADFQNKPRATDTFESDEEFLDLVQYHLVQYFLNESNKNNGLVKDRASNKNDDEHTIASIASVGFAIPAYVIGAERGWIKEQEAYTRVLKTLTFFNDSMEHTNGFYFHFVNMETAKREMASEVSSIDTALLLGGVLFARQYYKGTEVEEIATKLYERVVWPWMQNAEDTFSMGWKPTPPGGKFLAPRWSDYNECMLLYLLAIGSGTYSIDASAWDGINRPVDRYGEHVLIKSPPLFTHQYSHVFIDFRDKHDAYADYFKNSTAATLANREFCIDQKKNYKTYDEDIWGLTACDGPGGYKAYGAKPGHAHHDGTVAPTAAGGSIVFTPELSIRALRAMYDRYRDRLWGRYGFADAFNVDKNWFSREVIGIDQGTMLLMIENYRTGLIWRYVMQNPEIQKAMDAVGFQEGSVALSMPPEVTIQAHQRKRNIFIDGDLSEWEGLEPFVFNPNDQLDYGTIDDVNDCAVELYTVWDEEYLFVAARITDDEIVSRKGGDAIYKNDCLELYFDPADDGFVWGNPKDVQLGFSPDVTDVCHIGKSWAWFQKENPLETGAVNLISTKTERGFNLELAVKWSFMGITPNFNKKIRFTPAFHDADEEGASEAKLNAFFQEATGKDETKKLGFLELIAKKF